MKRPLLSILLALSLATLSSCRPTPAATEVPTATPEPTADLLQTEWDDRGLFEAGLIEDERGVLDQLPGATVYHIDLHIADDLMTVSGQQDVRYTNQEAVALTEVYFRLFPNLLGGRVAIEWVNVDGQEVTPVLEHADSALKVPLSAALEPGAQVVISLGYTVEVPTEAGANYGILALLEGILSLAHSYPEVAVYGDGGWNLEVPPTYGDVNYADSSFYLVSVLAPSDLILVTSGVEVQRSSLDGEQRVVFAAGPVRDFYLAASSEFVLYSEQVGETTVKSYAREDFAKGAQTMMRYGVTALKVFSRRFGTYPFSEFDIAATQHLALGVEYPGIVIITFRFYEPGQESFPPPVIESVLAHEVGHQWFYSVVGNDQVGEPWLDESLTQYITMLYWLDLDGSQAANGFRQSLLDRWQRVNNEPIPIGLPVGAYDESEYGAIVYGRGAVFFEALASAMGQEALDEFLRDYYQTFKWGLVTTDELKALAESHCGCDLTAMFAEWVYEP